MAATRRFDGIDIADQVGNGHIWSGQFFDVALLWSEICNSGAFAAFSNKLLASTADGRVRIVVDFASCDVWSMRIEQKRQGAKDATLCLSPQAEQNEVMPRQYCIHNLWDHRIVVANDPGKNRGIFTCSEAGNQVFTQFVLYPSRAQFFF